MASKTTKALVAVGVVGGAALLAWKFWPSSTPAPPGGGARGQGKGGDGLDGATQKDAEIAKDVGKGIDLLGGLVKLVGSRWGGGGKESGGDGTYEGEAPE